MYDSVWQRYCVMEEQRPGHEVGRPMRLCAALLKH